MNENMTVISYDMYNRAVNNTLTVNDAVNMLKECTKFRNLRDKLGAFAKGRDLRKVLTQGLCENHPEAKTDGIDRKVRNWLANRQSAIAKEDAIELCFILGLDIEESDSLLAMISEEGFHWRSPDEIPYIFALLHNMSYSEARKLHKETSEFFTDSSEENESAEVFTDIVKADILSIKNTQELKEYISNAHQSLGIFHNRAYSIFSEMMEKLETPAEDTLAKQSDAYYEENADAKYTVGNIVQTYLHGNELPKSVTGKSNVFSALQRNIAANWPGESALSRIKHRHSDVTRKLLILLFLATYDTDDYLDYDAYFNDEAENEKDANEEFLEFYRNMNTMLLSCGFSKLDPRSPFDWITIFCMCRDDLFMLDNTLSEFLTTLFSSDGNDTQN